MALIAYWIANATSGWAAGTLTGAQVKLGNMANDSAASASGTESSPTSGSGFIDETTAITSFAPGTPVTLAWTVWDSDLNTYTTPVVGTLTVKATSSATLATGYSVRASSLATLATGYSINSASSATLATGYSINSAGSAALATGYSINSAGSAALATGYSVRSASFAAVSTGYEVEAASGAGAATLSVGYSIRDASSATLGAGYSITTASHATLAAGFAIRADGSSVLPTGYMVSGGGSAILAVGYAVGATGFAALAAGYAVEGVVLGTIARPSADLSAGGWLPSTGTDLFDMINEDVASDADYIFTVSPSICEMRLTETAFPGTAAQKFSFRAKSSTGSTLTATLKQGATTIASWSQALTAIDTTYTRDLSPAEIALITAGPIDLVLEAA